MARVLVSGAAEHVASVAAVLRDRGAEVTEVVDLERVPAACAEAGPGAFDSYVQLPADFAVMGETAISRVHHLFAAGVLARFPALAGALPSLADLARITFVMWTLPPDVATPEDWQARQALIRVLIHAARADAHPTKELRVHVLDDGSTPEDIATRALGPTPTHEEVLDDARSYADWRVELLGLVSVET